MQTCTRSYFTLLSIFHTAILQMVNCDLSFYPHEIEVTVNSCVTLEMNLTDVNGLVDLKVTEDVAEVFPNEVLLTGNSVTNVSICGRNPGRSTLHITFLNNTKMRYSCGVTQISVYKSEFLVKLGYMMGWTYFIAWSICFYPQVYMNFKRKSVVGLNFDYVALSLVGFLLYSVYNCVLFWIPPVQAEYYERYPKGMIPVQLSDVEFALHATFIISSVIVQCFIYERDGQTLSRMTAFILIACFACLALSGVFVCLNFIKVLDFIIVCSYIKLITSLMKYTPQVILNYKRKSTNGWSIQTVMLDLTGGLLSTSQMIVISYNYDDWMSLNGNFSKFGLGISSVLFDVVFIFQHFILYRHSNNQIDVKKLALENNNVINGKKINLV